MQERSVMDETLTDQASKRQLKEAMARMFSDAPDMRPTMVALHAPGSVVTTEAPTKLRRKNGQVEEVPPGRYIVQGDGTWRAAHEGE